MKLGFFGIGSGRCAEPEVAVRVARAAESAGFDSVWTGEHVVLPDPQLPPSPAPPHFPMLDPAVALAFVAAHTEAILLGTGIVILPQRNPLVLAKELASLDVVSRGRLVFGLGVGYLKAEFEALGAPFEDRGARTDEYLQAIRALWTREKPSFEGRFARFSGVQSKPRPVQSPHPPIVVGGHSPAAFRRAVTVGNGWYGFFLDVERTRECVAGLERALEECDRPRELGALEISVTPSIPITPETARRFEDLGVHRLVPAAPARRKPDEIVEFVETTASTVP